MGELEEIKQSLNDIIEIIEEILSDKNHKKIKYNVEQGCFGYEHPQGYWVKVHYRKMTK